MKYATRENAQEGDTVLIPLQGEFMHDEQIMEEYEVVLAFRKKTHPSPVVGEGMTQNSEWLPFNEEMAYKNKTK